MHRIGLGFLIALLACDGEASNAGKPTAKPTSKADAKSDAKADAKNDAKAETKSDSKADAPEPKPPSPDEEHWLVWNADGNGFVTRWVADDGRTATTRAQAKALVHAAGDAVYVVQRKDAKVQVQTCACFDESLGPTDECATTGTVMQPGLAAKNLVDDKERVLVAPAEETVYGEVDLIWLKIVGGTDAGLLIREANSGYYCGAHGSYGGSDGLLRFGEEITRDFPKLEMPRAVREAAASDSAWEDYRECEGDAAPERDEFIDDVIEWSELTIAAVGGKPELTLGFRAWVPYVCAADYNAHGSAKSGLLKEAGSIGLAPPLPRAVGHALGEIGTADAVGWSKVGVAPEQRQPLLAKFAALPESKWPSPESRTKENKPAIPAAAKTKLDEGRTLTRAGDYPGAIALYDEVIALAPEFAKAWGERGYAKLLAGELEAAEKDCKKALEIEGKTHFAAAVHYNLGQIAERQGKPKKAKKAYAASLKLRPNKEVQKAHDAL